MLSVVSGDDWGLEARPPAYQLIGELNKNMLFIVYCKSGCHRSLKAYRLLKRNGFSRVKNMIGGIDEWSRIGRKIYKQDEGCPTKMPVWELGKGCED